MVAAHDLERRLLELERARKGADAVPLGVTLALGTAHFQAGSLPEAEREFRAVLAADPRSGDAHNNLAVVLMLTERPDEAEREAKLAAKAGVPVSPRLMDEIQKRKSR
jgi:Flp pilus assembly protein TadD